MGPVIKGYQGNGPHSWICENDVATDSLHFRKYFRKDGRLTGLNLQVYFHCGYTVYFRRSCGNGCETKSLSLNEHRGLFVFGNRVIRQTSGRTMADVELCASWLILFSIHQCDEMEENETGCACGTREEIRKQGFGGKTWKEETT
jgi:hypothetical protein